MEIYPDTIYLTDELGEITWCKEKINSTDVEYKKVTLSNIIWRGECDVCKGKKETINFPTNNTASIDPCSNCKGTGEITRPATMEEITKTLKAYLRQIWSGELSPYTAEMCKTINNGRLEIKE